MSTSSSPSSPTEAPTGDWPADGLQNVRSCPVCGSSGRRVMFAELRDRAFRTAPGSWTLWRCNECCSAYLDPRPSPETIGLAYRSYYTHGSAAGPPSVGRLRRALANDYLDASWGYDRTPRLPGGRLIPRVLRSRGAIVAREIRHLPLTRGGRLLDVGCGDGAFIREMAQLGWDAEGIDPDATAVAAARASGLKVRHGTLTDLAATKHGGAFDAITLSHVIEHVHDPAGDLRRIRDLLRAGGLVWLGTPNLEALGLRWFGRNWLGLDPPRHLTLFTRASLEQLVRSADLEPLAPPPPPPLAWQMYSQSAAIAQGRLPHEGPAHGAPRLRALAAIADRAAYRDPRYADELVVIARRPSP